MVQAVAEITVGTELEMVQAVAETTVGIETTVATEHIESVLGKRKRYGLVDGFFCYVFDEWDRLPRPATDLEKRLKGMFTAIVYGTSLRHCLRRWNHSEAFDHCERVRFPPHYLMKVHQGLMIASDYGNLDAENCPDFLVC